MQVRAGSLPPCKEVRQHIAVEHQTARAAMFFEKRREGEMSVMTKEMVEQHIRAMEIREQRAAIEFAEALEACKRAKKQKRLAKMMLDVYRDEKIKLLAQLEVKQEAQS
jgi:GTP cyclohydrolase II